MFNPKIKSLNSPIILLTMVSTFMVQCYSHFEYLPQNIQFNENDKLISIIKTDGRIEKYTGDYELTKLSDSLLVIYNMNISENHNEAKSFITADTINIRNISSINIYGYDPVKTYLFYIGSGIVLASIIFVQIMESKDPVTLEDLYK